MKYEERMSNIMQSVNIKYTPKRFMHLIGLENILSSALILLFYFQRKENSQDQESFAKRLYFSVFLANSKMEANY